MESLATALVAFFSQPWGVVGALCIMAAVTAFNSKLLQEKLARLDLSKNGMGLLLNGLNLVGGICLFINAMIRTESVWIVLEVYFVVVACKGIWQSLAGLAAESSQGAAPKMVEG